MPHRRQVVSTARHKYLQGVAKMMDMQDKLSALKGQISSMVRACRATSGAAHLEASLVLLAAPTDRPNQRPRARRCVTFAHPGPRLARSPFHQAPELERSRGEVEALMLLIGREKAEAEAAVQRFMPAEEAAMAAVAECEALRVACDAALRDVMPPLQAALRELRRIDKSSIAELKVMRSPPQGELGALGCVGQACMLWHQLRPSYCPRTATAVFWPCSTRTLSS